MNKDDGGPAFPLERTGIERDGALLIDGHHGMTLRDWFAGQALIGLLAEGRWAVAAGESYRIADAMLAARKDDPNDR